MVQNRLDEDEESRPLTVDADTQANILAAIRSVNQNLSQRIINGVKEVVAQEPQQGRVVTYRGPWNMNFFGPDAFENNFGRYDINASPSRPPQQPNAAASTVTNGRRQTI